ncbi:DUF6161 domain-containing protein [Pseudomonas atacamensis]|uniref:DUF6161 domain-containing protein n=1 Tax=Pseudomonas atacamensis TaxID=2565368 RepID=UPI00380D402F
MENFGVTHADRLSHVKALDETGQLAWFKNEREYWEKIFNIAGHHTGEQQTRILIQNYLTVIDGLMHGTADLQRLYQFHSNHSIPLHDEKPHADAIKEFTSRGQTSTGLYIFGTLLSQQTALYTGQYKSELIALEETFKSSFLSEHEKFKTAISESRDSIEKFIETTKKDVASHLFEKLDVATNEISNTVTSATNAILSAEPVKYWDDREKKHREKARSYRHGVIGSAIVFLVTIIFLTLSVYKNGETYAVFDVPITLPAEKFSIALLVICTTAMIWLIRILVKLMMTNLALEIEALERSTMIKTYIAIDSTRAEQAQEIRMLFYSTLFRPSNNSLTDDSTSPEYIRIIEAMLQKKA